MNNMLKEYDDMKEEIENLSNQTVYRRFQSIYKTILSYCFKCKKNIEIQNPKFVETKNGTIMLLSQCTVCDSKKSRFMKEQEPSGLLSSLG